MRPYHEERDRDKFMADPMMEPEVYAAQIKRDHEKRRVVKCVVCGGPHMHYIHFVSTAGGVE